jgi:uncharacterized BrkB/YihY/UPF0761 family membrane protein
MRAHTGLSIARHPLAFAREVLREFRRNQGLLLAGAVAYNTLLSNVPLLILLVFALQFVVSREELLSTLDRYIELVAPATGDAVVSTLAAFLADGAAMSGILLASLLLFSSLAFGALESAMAVIFHHRVRATARHWLVSAVIPYGFVLVLGVGLLIVTIVSGALPTKDELARTRSWKKPPVNWYCSTSVRACWVRSAGIEAPLRLGSSLGPSSMRITIVPSNRGTPAIANSKKPK